MTNRSSGRFGSGLRRADFCRCSTLKDRGNLTLLLKQALDAKRHTQRKSGAYAEDGSGTTRSVFFCPLAGVL